MKRGEPGPGVVVIPILTDADIVEARMAARTMAAYIGFVGADLVIIATAVSEVARNIIEYAKTGEVVLSVVHRGSGSTRGIQVVARDQGPGIPDIAKAMQDGFSTSRSLGLGLPGAKRLVDEFEIESEVGKGTVVTMRMWSA